MNICRLGGGNRYCIGSAMAMLEMKLVLATVLLNWRLDLVDRRSMKPIRRGLTVAPPAGLRMKILGKDEG